MNALQKQVRQQSVQLRHLKHEMLERERNLEKHSSQIAQIVQAVAGEAEMQWYHDATSSQERSEHPPVFESLLALDKALRTSSSDVGAMEASDLVYQSQMQTAEKLRVKYEKEIAADGVKGCLIQHDIHSSAPLGISLNQECKPDDYADITEISKEASRAHGNLAEKIHPGMYLCAVGDFDCDAKSVQEISEEIHHAPRPLVLTCALPSLVFRVGEHTAAAGDDPDGISEELQIQCVVNALQKQVREQQVPVCLLTNMYGVHDLLMTLMFLNPGGAQASQARDEPTRCFVGHPLCPDRGHYQIGRRRA